VGQSGGVARGPAEARACAWMALLDEPSSTAAIGKGEDGSQREAAHRQRAWMTSLAQPSPGMGRQPAASLPLSSAHAANSGRAVASSAPAPAGPPCSSSDSAGEGPPSVPPALTGSEPLQSAVCAAAALGPCRCACPLRPRRTHHVILMCAPAGKTSNAPLRSGHPCRDTRAPNGTGAQQSPPGPPPARSQPAAARKPATRFAQLPRAAPSCPAMRPACASGPGGPDPRRRARLAGLGRGGDR